MDSIARERKRAVLFFDSSPSLLPLKRALRERGLLLFECRTPAELLFAARELPVALILIDLLVPGEPSGYDLCRRLRSEPRVASAAVYLFCDHPLPIQVTQGYAYDLGADRLIVPPIDPVYLARQISLAVRIKEKNSP